MEGIKLGAYKSSVLTSQFLSIDIVCTTIYDITLIVEASMQGFNLTNLECPYLDKFLS
jgi:hypothetical protein